MAAAFQVQGWGSCFFFFFFYLPAIIILGGRVFGDIQSHQCALMDDSCKTYALQIGLLGYHSFLFADLPISFNVYIISHSYLMENFGTALSLSNGHWSLEVSST
ncbi:uncharacterized protein FFE2_01321 [Fusarium fujikuroi]|nr:uncharacterized protein FFE2_01321 [Fusarium fujikuroi]